MREWLRRFLNLSDVVTCNDCGLQIDKGFAQPIQCGDRHSTRFVYFCGAHFKKYERMLGLSETYSEFLVDPATGDPEGYLPKTRRAVQEWLDRVGVETIVHNAAFGNTTKLVGEIPIKKDKKKKR